MSAPSRRDFIEKAAYVAPAILTLQAAPAFAKPGSQKGGPPRHHPKDGPRDWPGNGPKGGPRHGRGGGFPWDD